MSEEKSITPLSFKDAVKANISEDCAIKQTISEDCAIKQTISEKNIENKNDEIVVKKSDDFLPTFDEIKDLTEKSKDKSNSAIKEFIDELNSNKACIKDKINKAASNGCPRVNFYIFQWTDDRDATHDSRGNKIIYGDNIHLSTLIKKNGDKFFEELNKFFNQDGSDRLKCGLFIQKRNEENPFNVYHLYVSWGQKDKEFTPGYKRVSNK